MTLMESIPTAFAVLHGEKKHFLTALSFTNFLLSGSSQLTISLKNQAPDR
jgi:hypothetical protein